MVEPAETAVTTPELLTGVPKVPPHEVIAAALSKNSTLPTFTVPEPGEFTVTVAV